MPLRRKRISLEGEREGGEKKTRLCDMQCNASGKRSESLAEKQLFHVSPHSEGNDRSVSFKVPYIRCLLAAERANPAALCRASSAAARTARSQV